MCDCPQHLLKGWAGWNVPGQSSSKYSPNGDWVDLSYPLDENSPRVPFFPAPDIKRVRSLPEYLINVTQMSMIVHTGTHIDAPIHLFEDAPPIQDIPLERLSGTGYILPVDTEGGYLIEPSHLEAAGDNIRAGEILLLNTGTHKLVHTDAYEDHPSLSVAAAQWLLDRGVKFLGVDFPTPDNAVQRRDDSFNYPVHRTLLGNGVLIAEHLTNLDTLSGQRVEIICAALNITHSDGSPVRMLARPITEQ